jgi:hypothetical protein
MLAILINFHKNLDMNITAIPIKIDIMPASYDFFVMLKIPTIIKNIAAIIKIKPPKIQPNTPITISTIADKLLSENNLESMIF